MITTPFYCCLGMPGSGSTWLYNVALRVAIATVEPGTMFYAGMLNSVSELDCSVINTGRFFIMKCHHVDDEMMEAIRPVLQCLLISIRDPRDAIVSLSSHVEHTFDTALNSVIYSALATSQRVQEEHATVFRYEDGFTDDLSTVQRIADAMSLDLTAEKCREIFDYNSRRNVEARILDLRDSGILARERSNADLADRVTQWRLGHIGRSGKVGAWREHLTAAQLDRIYERLGDWMQQNGYQ
jgi:hypothetical protein